MGEVEKSGNLEMVDGSLLEKPNMPMKCGYRRKLLAQAFGTVETVDLMNEKREQSLSIHEQTDDAENSLTEETLKWIELNRSCVVHTGMERAAGNNKYHRGGIPVAQ